MNLLTIICAIIVWGITYTATKVATYKLLTRIDMENLDRLVSKLPKYARRTVKYLKSEKAKDIVKDLHEAIDALFSDTTVVEPASKEE